MLRYQRFVGFLVTIILPGMFVVYGCSSKGTSKGDGGNSAKSSIDNAIEASGSTFVAPLMARWVDSYQKLHPKTSIRFVLSAAVRESMSSANSSRNSRRATPH